MKDYEIPALPIKQFLLVETFENVVAETAFEMGSMAKRLNGMPMDDLHLIEGACALERVAKKAEPDLQEAMEAAINGGCPDAAIEVMEAALYQLTTASVMASRVNGDTLRSGRGKRFLHLAVSAALAVSDLGYVFKRYILSRDSVVPAEEATEPKVAGAAGPGSAIGEIRAEGSVADLDGDDLLGTINRSILQISGLYDQLSRSNPAREAVSAVKRAASEGATAAWALMDRVATNDDRSDLLGVMGELVDVAALAHGIVPEAPFVDAELLTETMVYAANRGFAGKHAVYAFPFKLSAESMAKLGGDPVDPPPAAPALEAAS